MPDGRSGGGPPKHRGARHCPLRHAVLAERATPLLITAALRSAAPTVLLPGLYCPDVAAALLTAGIAVRYYDLDHSLTPVLPSHGDGARAAVIWFHPFGLYRQPPAGLTVIVDACHAFRTLAAHPPWPGVTVFSLRKEFGWPRGAAATGLPPAGCTTLDSATARRLRRLDVTRSAVQGRAVTALAAARLGAHLPPLRDGDVLAHLPLLAECRDGVIDRLRQAGIAAWRWLVQLPGAPSQALPVSTALRRHLLLVPLPHGAAMAAHVLDHLTKEALLPWQAAGAVMPASRL